MNTMHTPHFPHLSVALAITVDFDAQAPKPPTGFFL